MGFTVVVRRDIGVYGDVWGIFFFGGGGGGWEGTLRGLV